MNVKSLKCGATMAIRPWCSSAQSEEVTDVSLGDGLAWHVDIPARKNLLFLKPVAAYAATNLTVLTNRPSLDGSGPLVRVYVFSLVANIPREEGISAALHAAESAAAIPTSGSAATTPADFTWVIHFHYPEDQAERLALRVRRNQSAAIIADKYRPRRETRLELIRPPGIGSTPLLVQAPKLR